MKYLILGAGPAGLTFANKLKEAGETNFLVLEREKEAGGLCRSMYVDGSPLDIGGGHFLDVRLPEVNQFLFQFMPEEEWNLYERDSRIIIGKNVIGHPLEANLWQMELDEQIEYLKSIARAGCVLGAEEPENFVEWIYWKLGARIAEDYMIPYNQKMFGRELHGLGTYWLEKLPNVSFEETLRSCLTRQPCGSEPGHAQFYYPKKFGYGELWRRMAEQIQGHIQYGSRVKAIDFTTRTVKTETNEEYQGDTIVTTIPWMEFREIMGMPGELRESLGRLRFNSVQVEYFPEHMDTEAHWLYCPDISIPYHRILVRHNFCPDSRGYWTETNCERIDKERENTGFRYVNPYAYPFNTVEKPDIMKRLLTWSRKQGVYGIGRWGEHQHYNSDVTVGMTIKLFERLSEG